MLGLLEDIAEKWRKVVKNKKIPPQNQTKTNPKLICYQTSRRVESTEWVSSGLCMRVCARAAAICKTSGLPVMVEGWGGKARWLMLQYLGKGGLYVFSNKYPGCSDIMIRCSPCPPKAQDPGSQTLR